MDCLTGKRCGTCDSSECALHGVCHCGCGRTMKLSPNKHRPSAGYPEGMTRGMPYMHAAGHTVASRRNLNPGWKRPGWYVDKARALELINYLVVEYGTVTEAARRAGLARDTLVRLRGGRLQRVWPQTLTRLERAWARADEDDGPYIDLAPLLAYIARQGIALSSLGETWERRFYRGSCSVFLADEMCTWFGVHPSYIWGPAWFDYGMEAATA